MPPSALVLVLLLFPCSQLLLPTLPASLQWVGAEGSHCHRAAVFFISCKLVWEKMQNGGGGEMQYARNNLQYIDR